ncbi:hypothetical protein [Tumebacillus permanentifrigoris]|uniref:Uncharacterized protein n=1 Tax=Tumebacillus permanentifrigoris TaxID=378543 RepID=A0A316DDF4_9BACL|nr:hypothetical protein [Tumebacillus permanentifrigoris]PWK16005.1 hypothetical protein C7459_102251 [Tumebacillus permanentifrigoris]
MKKTRLLLATLLTLSLLTAPVLAADGQGEPGKNAGGVGGKHNFDQWQTIKRLQIHN